MNSPEIYEIIETFLPLWYKKNAFNNNLFGSKYKRTWIPAL